MWNELYQTLTDFEFLEAKCTHVAVTTEGSGPDARKVYGGVFELQEDDRLAGTLPGGVALAEAALRRAMAPRVLLPAPTGTRIVAASLLPVRGRRPPRPRAPARRVTLQAEQMHLSVGGSQHETLAVSGQRHLTEAASRVVLAPQRPAADVAHAHHAGAAARDDRGGVRRERDKPFRGLLPC